MSTEGDIIHNKFKGWRKDLKAKATLPIRIEDIMDYQESLIKSHYSPPRSCLGCYKSNRYSVNPEFMYAYERLNIQEKVDYYSTMAEFLISCSGMSNQDILRKISEMGEESEMDKVSINARYEMGKIFRSWVDCEIRLNLKDNILRILPHDKKQRHLELAKYLVHREEDKNLLKFEPCKPDTAPAKLLFSDWNTLFNSYQLIKKLLDKAVCHNMYLIIQDYRIFEILPPEIPKKDSKVQSPDSISELSPIKRLDKSSPFYTKGSKGFEETLKEDEVGEVDQGIASSKQILSEFNEYFQQVDPSRQKITDKLISGYLTQIQNIDKLDNFTVVEETKSSRLLENRYNPCLLKMIHNFSQDSKRVVCSLLDVHKYSKWNHWIKSAEIEEEIPQENSAVVSQHYFPGIVDTKVIQSTFKRHVFNDKEAILLVDMNTNKEENLQLYSIWKVESQPKGCKLTIEIRFCELQVSQKISRKLQESLEILGRYLFTTESVSSSCFNLNWRVRLLPSPILKTQKFYTAQEPEDLCEFHSILDFTSQQFS